MSLKFPFLLIKQGNRDQNSVFPCFSPFFPLVFFFVVIVQDVNWMGLALVPRAGRASVGFSTPLL